MLELLFISAGVAVGAAIGSFLGCAFYRVPRGRSLLFPPSTCLQCQRRLGWRELVPVFSFLMQRGRCGCGKTPLRPSYFVCEIMCAVVGGVVVAWVL